MLKEKKQDTTDGSKTQKPLRLWPGLALAAIVLLARFAIPAFVPSALFYGIIAGMIGTVAILVWWLFFSRAAWVERLGAFVLMAIVVAATFQVLHKSIATGAMGMLFYILAIPVLALALVAWAAATRNLSTVVRRVTLVATVVVACGVWTLIRTGGFTGEGRNDFAWRWSETPEEQLLAETADDMVALDPAQSADESPEESPMKVAGSEVPGPENTQVEPPNEQVLARKMDKTVAVQPVADAVETEVDWPGFRGAKRDGIIHGVMIETNWSATPPVEIWRRQVGPGWSSFAVNGDVFYTQEQRGEDEIVACYNLNTGEPVWMHRDSARFWESNAGAGPRGTPTLMGGRIYTFGATGIVNVLNAEDGTVVWSRNAAEDTGVKTPGWGFSSSPLVVDNVVIIAVEGVLAGYDRATGAPLWSGPKGGYGYSSPQLLTLDGVRQVVLLRGSTATSVAPSDGKVLWEHAMEKGTSIVQPALTPDGDLLLSYGEQSGMQRVAVTQAPEGWTVEERWTTNGLKPYFSDFVIHDGFAYGFDGSILACINIENGKRTWKGGRYGSGQMVLLADQDLLLVLSEKGELALVSAKSDQFTELARVPAIESKTWNHPVVVGDVLLVRNAQEMAAFRLALLGT